MAEVKWTRVYCSTRKRLGKVNEKNDLLLITVGICGMKGVVMDLMMVYLVVCQSASVHVCSKNKSIL